PTAASATNTVVAWESSLGAVRVLLSLGFGGVMTKTGAGGNGGSMATVFSMAGTGAVASAVSSAATKSSQRFHRVAGSLAMPRRITASTRGPSVWLTMLGASGAR